MKHLKVTLYIGMNDKDSHKQEYSRDYFVNKVRRYFPSCTIVNALGVWNSEEEDTLVVNLFEEVVSKEAFNAELAKCVQRLKEELNQEAILVHIEPADFELM